MIHKLNLQQVSVLNIYFYFIFFLFHFYVCEVLGTFLTHVCVKEPTYLYTYKGSEPPAHPYMYVVLTHQSAVLVRVDEPTYPYMYGGSNPPAHLYTYMVLTCRLFIQIRWKWPNRPLIHVCVIPGNSINTYGNRHDCKVQHLEKTCLPIPFSMTNVFINISL